MLNLCLKIQIWFYIGYRFCFKLVIQGGPELLLKKYWLNYMVIEF